jgi:hypothetical protein
VKQVNACRTLQELAEKRQDERLCQTVKVLEKALRPNQVTNINTEGGSVINGNLHVDGDFVNRDKIVNCHLTE